MKEKRNIGLDLLRIISMMMIMTLHYLGKGEALIINTKMKYVVWFMEIFCMTSVNLYVLISGYFLVDSKFKWKKVFKICKQVWFYSIIFMLLEFCIYHSLSYKEILISIFPIILKVYWFVTIYLFMYILSSYLNALINNITKSEYKKLLFINIFIFSILHLGLPAMANLNPQGGYGIIWFIILYLIAGYIKKYGVKINISKYLMITICLITTFAITILRCSVNNTKLLEFIGRLYEYYSIFILVNSILIFLLFLNLKIENKKIVSVITFIASLTFGVYLIHENVLVAKHLYRGVFNSLKWAFKGIVPFTMNYILFIVIIFTLCILLDYIRKILFIYVEKSSIYGKISRKIDKKYHEGVEV